MSERLSAWQRLRTRFDWILFGLIAALVSAGLLNLWSAVRDRQPGLLRAQLCWLGLGGVVFVATTLVDSRRILRAAYLLYAMGVGTLAWVLFAGRAAGGARRWLELGPLSVQPSELVKVLLVLALARHIHDAPSLVERTFRHLLVPLLLVGAPALLVAAQPDLDNALIMVLIFGSVMLTARLSLRTWVSILLVCAAAAGPIYKYGLRDYQRERVVAFLDPSANEATAWQPRHAMNALGSGRVWGKGYLDATYLRVRGLPALWTDYPFAMVGEEWGFLGCAFLVCLAGALVLWILKVSRDARDRFSAMACIGCAAMLFWQSLINIAMVSGLLPVAGATLPLISYGGSSSLAVMFTLGLVMNVSVRRRP